MWPLGFSKKMSLVVSPFAVGVIAAMPQLPTKND